jgi:hypothetical protein
MKIRVISSLTRAKWQFSIIRSLGLLLVFALPTAALAQDYPNGVNATGVVTQTWTICDLFRFVIHGTRDDGTVGDQAFWINDSATAVSLRAAHVLAAAAQGKTVSIWNYGQSYSCGGQSGYLSSIEIVFY